MRPVVPCQLKRKAALAVRTGHPWVFREGLTQSFEDGQWLQLLDERRQPLGYGIYQAEGGLAVRMLGSDLPRGDWMERHLRRAMRKRSPLLRETEAYRLVNGESDGIPGVVLDVYGSTAVLQTYSAGVDALGRYAGLLALRQFALESLWWKFPARRSDQRSQTVRALRGDPPALVSFREGELRLTADLRQGQKSGTFLDLRGLRRWLAAQDMRGQRVLNLFAYTGTAGLACCQAGAESVLNVDSAPASLEFGRLHHPHRAQQWLCADIFAQIGELGQDYDWIVVDPPSMASRQDQVPKALAIYRRLYRALLPRLRAGGRMLACCCTSRIPAGRFEAMLREALPGLKVHPSLPMEPDHRAAFAEARYLKVVLVGSA